MTGTSLPAARARTRLVGGAVFLALVAAFLVVAILQGSVAEPSPGPSPGPGAPVLHPEPWALAATPDGAFVYAACGPRHVVAEIDVERQALARFLPVRAAPRGLAVSPEGTRLAVTLLGEDRVLVLDRESGRVLLDLPAGPDPQGVVFSRDGKTLYVAERTRRTVARIDLAARKVTGRIEAGEEPFALVLSPDGLTLVAVSRRATIAPPDSVPTSEVTVIDRVSWTVRHRVALDSLDLADSAAFTPDGSRVLVPAIHVRNLLPIVQVGRGWVMSSVLAVVDVSAGTQAALPLTGPTRGFADPSGIALLEGGTRAFVASGGGNEVGVIDVPALLAHEDRARPGAVERLSLSPLYLRRRVPLGANPRGVVAVRGGRGVAVAVSERLDDQVALLDREGGLVARVAVGDPLPEDRLHRGQRAFFDARYCFQKAFSCTSCHPEAHTDGLTYDFEIDGVGKDVVLNRSLRGLKGTAPFKWSGINPDLPRQCGARFAMVLTRADLMPPPVLDDLAAWLLSLPPPRPLLDLRTASPKEGALIRRGRAIFERSRSKEGRRLRPSERCITCHPPPHYTNRQRIDVGTRAPGDLRRAFDTPHLEGVGRKAPFLHDGRAPTLRAIWKGTGNRHGHVSDLSEDDFEALVAFLRSL